MPTKLKIVSLSASCPHTPHEQSEEFFLNSSSYRVHLYCGVQEKKVCVVVLFKNKVRVPLNTLERVHSNYYEKGDDVKGVNRWYRLLKTLEDGL